jgi:amino acid adenylation domain-containing protein/non-ribosomal peptide synthase protein (TIGR01720 family)
MQEGMLFHTLYEPEAGLYFDQLLFTIEGIFNVTAWQQAWQQVTERHAVLRTACVWDGLKKPLQLVFTKLQVPWIKQDWRGLNKSQQQEQLTAFLHTEKSRGVDLTVAPLMRCALIQLKDNQYYFIWTYHHLLLDGWAEPIILTDLIAFYESNCQGSSLRLAPVPLYRDYIAWLQQQDLKSAQTFWQTQLAGFSAPTPLGVDKLTNKAEVETQYGEQVFHLSWSTTEALQSLAKTHHVTLNTLVQGAWALLLSRYSGENDVVFGVVVSGRPTALAGVENMVGLFINTLPMRVSVSPNALLLPWLQGLYSKQIESDEYSYAPLVDIQGWSEVKGGVSLFDSLLIFENYPIDESLRQGTMGSLTIHSVQAIEKTNYPLLLEVALTRSEFRFNISYNLSRFETNTVSRMMGHLRTLLKGMIIEPEAKRLGDIPLLTATEQQQFLAWNETATDYPHDKTLVNLFEDQVDKTPDAIAVVFENQQLTYQELNTKANQLGHYLQTLGVKPEILVGICLERSFSLIIGILGILKAGGAYLPLDPSYPEARLAFMLEDAQTPVLLTQSSLTKKLPKTTALTIFLDVEIETLSGLSQENPNSGLKPENLAYVIYTSGSTGKPKGTLIIHQGLVNYLSWSVDTYQVAKGLGAPVHSSLGFDATITSLFSPLLAGQRILLLPDKQEVEAVLTAIYSFRDWSLVKITPAHLEILNTLLSEEQLPGKTRFLILGGEALPSSSLSLWRTFAPNTRIINEYGPTETVVGCCIYEVDAKTPPEGIVPIGYPIANTQLYILDHFLQRVPIGVSGELHIGGDGIARGYLNRPELTAERFIKNPFSDNSNARLYKTGDLARYLPNGNIEYLGRIDNQVKIRGFRIELGEIEAVLEQHPSVQQNAVIVQETEEIGKRLIAYLIPPPEQIIDKTELAAFLQERLPHYMVPSSFVILEAMPLTPNGKIDRRALARLSLDNDLLLAKTFVAPQTPEEELLASIWADILSIPKIGLYDNFFELGGHSLLATQVMSRIRDTFAIELPLRDLFESPTLFALSTRLKQARQQSPLPAITSLNRSESLPLSFAQQRLWFLNQLEGPSATYNMPEALRLEGPLQQPALIQSLQELVQRHESLRTIFPTIHGKPSIQILVNNFSLLIIDLSHLTPSAIDNEVHRLVDEDVQRPFDLENEPLFRATLLKVSTTSHVLLLNMHHIISDGWSTEVLIREWGMLYEAFSQGKPSPLLPLAIQYVDYAHWQRQWLTGEVLEEQVAYWKQQLAGSPALLELPTDKLRPPVQSFQGASLPLQLNLELMAKLKQLSQQTGVTLFMTLWSAFATLLCRYSGQTDIVIGSPIANRTLSQTESVVGFFVNTLVLRLNLSNNPSFETLLQQARQVALEAYTHQDIPFESVVEELKPVRNLSHSPLFQVMLVLQNTLTSESEVNLAGLNVAPIEREQVIAKFDLTLALEEKDEGLAGELEYNTDLFESATIARWIEHFKMLLTGLVTHPQQSIHELPLLTKVEQEQLLAWNKTTTDYSPDKTLVDLFEEQVNKTPDAIAVVFENQSLTYQALNTKANQLAHYLQTFGVKPEVLVGICLERSLEMIIGLLGILKAGGAYLPLDPAYPVARLAFMLEDAQISVLLTHSILKEKLPETATTKIYLNIEAEKISRLSAENPANKAKPENLAYVIYTSGSTGQSKGVLLEHGGLCNLAQAEIKAFGIQYDSCILQFASLSFDVATSDIAMAFASGASLNLITQDATLSPQELVHILKEQSITHFEIPASVLTTLPFEKLPTLQAFIVGGEACPPNLVAQWSTEQRFFNAYGPTEATVCATFFENQGTSFSTLPIGKPIANTQAYILDTYLQQCPVGIPGELHIGGIGLARGYLNRPDLTAERFIKNPFNQAPNARLYKTGDLARYLPDGNIEYLGRIDNQVKIRGFRIELGEIETVLGQHKVVRENAVIVQETSPTDKRLIAYIVLYPSLQTEQIETKELHDFLKERLPTYMIPAAFFTLEALPLTPNGKIDRQALVGWASLHETHQRETHQIQFSTNFVPPQTPTEELLAAIWIDVLNLKQVGIHDNFFELGGDSIISIQVISRANQAGLQLTPKQLFQHQTIAELAIIAQTTERSSQAEQGLVTGEVPLTPIQHWFFAQQLLEAHHFNQAVLLKVSPKLQPEQLETIVSQLLQHHDILRLRFVTGEKPVITDNCSLFTDNESLITIKDLSHLPPTEQSSVIEATATELQARLNFEKGPLLRVALFFVGAEQLNRLFWVIHHLVIDGVSWRILLEDFVTAWQQLSRGENIVLPPKTTSFQQWAKRLTVYAVSESLLAELEKWITEAHWQVKPLPVDSHSRQALPNTVAKAEQITVSLNQAQTHALLNEVPATYQTQINDILLTALVQSFAEWTGEKLLLIDLEGHGREELFADVDLSRTVGWFTSQFPVLLDLRTVANEPGAAIKAIKEQLRQIPQHGIGYGILRYLNSDTASQLKMLPQAQVIFNYLGQFQNVSTEPLLGFASEDSGTDSSLLNHRVYLLEINGSITEEQLQFTWSYSQNDFLSATIEQLALHFVIALQTLITHCQSPEVGGYTPSDFTTTKLSQELLDDILDEFGE